MRRSSALQGVAALASIGIVRAPARAAQYVMKIGTDITIDHPVNVNMTQMWRAVEKASGGRIQAQIFPNSQLGGETSMFEQTRQGALQFFLVPPGVIAATVPVADISYLGFAFKDQSEGMRVFQGPLGTYVRSQIAAKGLQVLRTPWDVGMQQVGLGPSWHPIRTPDDIRACKIRLAPSAILVGMMKQLGANGVSLNVAETYTSLQTKLVDGSAGPLQSVLSFKFYEVMKYLSLTNHNWATFYLMGNGDYWKSLPGDLQDLIERTNTKFALNSHRTMVQLNTTLQDKLTRLGLSFNAVDTDAFRARLKPYYQYWANQFGPTPWGLLETSLNQKLT